MVVNGNFDGYITLIQFWETPGRPKVQTLYNDQWQKMPYFGPKNGPKWSKTAHIAILLLYKLVMLDASFVNMPFYD